MLKVNGIGAKASLSILGGMSLNELMKAISQSESDLLVKIPGIGKKTADKISFRIKR